MKTPRISTFLPGDVTHDAMHDGITRTVKRTEELAIAIEANNDQRSVNGATVQWFKCTVRSTAQSQRSRPWKPCGDCQGFEGQHARGRQARGDRKRTLADVRRFAHITPRTHHVPSPLPLQVDLDTDAGGPTNEFNIICIGQVAKN